ncbi:SAM-dependent methyltransferase, partial [Staphylococcus capitis]
DYDTYIYGKEANQYVKSVFLEKVDTPKKVLMLAEGEGRNAVYLATLGYDVTTYDLSKVGIEKELKLAEEAGVTVDAN